MLRATFSTDSADHNGGGGHAARPPAPPVPPSPPPDLESFAAPSAAAPAAFVQPADPGGRGMASLPGDLLGGMLGGGGWPSWT